LKRDELGGFQSLKLSPRLTASSPQGQSGKEGRYSRQEKGHPDNQCKAGNEAASHGTEQYKQAYRQADQRGYTSPHP